MAPKLDVSVTALDELRTSNSEVLRWLSIFYELCLRRSQGRSGSLGFFLLLRLRSGLLAVFNSLLHESIQTTRRGGTRLHSNTIKEECVDIVTWQQFLCSKQRAL